MFIIIIELLDKIASADKDQQQIVDTAERLAAAKVSSTFDHHGDNNGNDGEVENKADPLVFDYCHYYIFASLFSFYRPL